jgi:tRNA modification GTPase
VTEADTTWVSCLTPPGQGALGTLGLHGPTAWALARALFRPRSGGELPATPALGSFRLGRVAEGTGDGLGDEVVLAVKTVEPTTLEIHCHGGRVVVGVLQELFTARGARACGWDDWLRRTTADPLQAEAAVALTRATTARTAAILLDQHAGALRRVLSVACAALDRGDLAAALTEMKALHAQAALGQHLTRPWRLVVAGAPNVGKSSLVNALAGFERCVVADTPGTTRDVVTTRIALDGWPVELVDTAGLRDGGAALEGQGMALARAEAANADLVLWLLDGSALPVWPEIDRANVRCVVNKADLPAAWSADPAWPRVSARTGLGLAELVATVAAWLVPAAPPAEAAVPFTTAQATAVEMIVADLVAGRTEAAREKMADMGRGT